MGTGGRGMLDIVSSEAHAIGTHILGAAPETRRRASGSSRTWVRLVTVEGGEPSHKMALSLHVFVLF